MAVATTFEDETIAMPKPRQWMLEEPMSSIVLAVLELEQNKKVSELGASLISLHRAAIVERRVYSLDNRRLHAAVAGASSSGPVGVRYKLYKVYPRSESLLGKRVFVLARSLESIQKKSTSSSPCRSFSRSSERPLAFLAESGLHERVGRVHREFVRVAKQTKN